MLKKIRKYLVVLMAVVLVASFAVIPTSACPLEGDVSDGFYPQGGGQFAYGADAWAYCADSPYWCYLNTTAGYDWAGGDPGMSGGTARASVYVSGLTLQEARDHDIIDAGYGCHC